MAPMFNSFVSKFKDKHVITISLEVVNEKFLKDKPLYLKRIRYVKRNNLESINQR